MSDEAHLIVDTVYLEAIEMRKCLLYTCDDNVEVVKTSETNSGKYIFFPP